MIDPTPENLNRILSAYHLAWVAKEYASSLIFETEQVDGDNYNMVWSEEFNGSFPPVND